MAKLTGRIDGLGSLWLRYQLFVFGFSAVFFGRTEHSGAGARPDFFLGRFVVGNHIVLDQPDFEP